MFFEASGALKLAGAVTGAGVLQIDSGATLELAAATTAFIGFAGATGTVQLDAPGSVAARIAGFTGSDVINLGGAVASGLSYNTASKLLTVTGASGTIASLGFSGTYAQANFTLNPAGTDILFVATPLTAQPIGAAPPGFLPPPDTGVAPAPAWTWDGAGAAAGLPTWCPLSPQQPFGQTADPAAVPGGTALAWGLDRTHSPIPAPPHQPFGGQ